MKTIIGIALPQDWQEAIPKGQYVKSTIDSTLEEVGFIHCSMPDQSIDIVNRKYLAQDSLLLLFIDVDKVNSKVKFEGALSGRAGVFPHIYGPLNTDAVYETISLEKVDGRFVSPKELIKLNKEKPE